MTRFSQSIAIKAPIERVYDVVTDFARYPEFLKDVESAEVVSEAKGKARVAFVLTMVTRVRYTLDFLLKPPGKVSWTMVEGELMKSNEGSWTLEALEKHLTDATFTIDMELPFWIPASMAESLVSSSMPAMLEGFKTEAERPPAARKPRK